MQSRKGTRPYRVGTLLNRERAAVDQSTPNLLVQNPENDQPLPAEPDTGDEESMGKSAARLSERKEKALSAFAKARPYVAEGVAAGVPAAVLGNIYGGKRTAKIFGAVGTGAGVLNRSLKDWAEKNKRKRVARELLES